MSFREGSMESKNPLKADTTSSFQFGMLPNMPLR